MQKSYIDKLAYVYIKDGRVLSTPETIKQYGTFEEQAHGKPEGTIVRMTCYT